MKKLLRTFLAGVMIVAPLAITAWVVLTLANWLGGMGKNLLDKVGATQTLNERVQMFAPAIGAIVVLAAIYCVGLLANFWLFGKLFQWFDNILSQLPGIKTIYGSVRDLMKLFGGESKKMGRVVHYTPPGSDVSILGIVTNDHPEPTDITSRDKKVAVYLPLSYMIGGPTVLVSPEHLKEIKMPVEQAMKLAATAYIGSHHADASSPETAKKKSDTTPPPAQPQG